MTSAVPDYPSRTYLLTSIAEFVDSITYRCLADGLLMQDLEYAKEQVMEWSEWCDAWIARAGHHERLADRAFEAGRQVTGVGHLVRASLCAHFGQFLFFEFPEAKERGVRRKVALFERVAPLLSPPAERVSIPFLLGDLPAYLRLPAGPGPHPCVVQVGGMDASKEDSLQFGNLLLERGLATLAFDGPGQGETYYRGMRLFPGWPQAVSAVIDWLEGRPEIDGSRIGMIGRSTGGFLAPRAAADEARVKALVVWGAMYDLGAYELIPPLVQQGFVFITAAKSLEEAARQIDLAGHAERITCPTYVVHGGRDNITPPSNAYRLVKEVSGPTRLDLYEDGIHCNHDLAYLVRPDMADWLAEQLRSTGPRSAGNFVTS